MKMALQISIVETAANQENRCSALQASVYSAKSPTTFVDGVSSGKSRFYFAPRVNPEMPDIIISAESPLSPPRAPRNLLSARDSLAEPAG